MKENISRSSIFRSKMKLDAAKRNEEKLAEDVKRSEENRKNMGNQGRINSEVYSSKYFAEHILDVYKIAIKNKNKQKKSIGEKIIEIIGGRK